MGQGCLLLPASLHNLPLYISTRRALDRLVYNFVIIALRKCGAGTTRDMDGLLPSSFDRDPPAPPWRFPFLSSTMPSNCAYKNDR